MANSVSGQSSAPGDLSQPKFPIRSAFFSALLHLIFSYWFVLMPSEASRVVVITLLVRKRKEPRDEAIVVLVWLDDSGPCWVFLMSSIIMVPARSYPDFHVPLVALLTSLPPWQVAHGIAADLYGTSLDWTELPGQMFHKLSLIPPAYEESNKEDKNDKQSKSKDQVKGEEKTETKKDN